MSVATVYSDAAVRLADRIAESVTPDTEGSPTWLGDDLDPVALAVGQTSLVRGQLDDGLLTGRAGIALSLAVCAGLPGGNPRWASLARRTSAAAVRASAATLPGGQLGWSSGAFGVARAADVVSRLIGDDPATSGAAHLGLLGLEALQDAPDRLPPWPDLLGGVAGVLIGLACTPLPPGHDAARGEALARLIRRLAAMGVADASGVRWPMATTETPVVGLAHGASGIALALLVAARRLEGHTPGVRRSRSSGRHSDAAALARRWAGDALRWEEGLWDADRGGWPDLRKQMSGPGLAWCHGALGVGLIASLLASAEPGTRLAGTAHVAYLRAAQAAQLHRPASADFDATLCHGLGGVVELHLAASRAWPTASAEHLRRARQVADGIVANGRPAWTCGVPAGGWTPNLLVGTAGVALTLARCHDPALAPSPGDPTLSH